MGGWVDAIHSHIPGIDAHVLGAQSLDRKLLNLTDGTRGPFLEGDLVQAFVQVDGVYPVGV